METYFLAAHLEYWGDPLYFCSCNQLFTDKINEKQWDCLSRNGYFAFSPISLCATHFHKEILTLSQNKIPNEFFHSIFPSLEHITKTLQGYNLLWKQTDKIIILFLNLMKIAFDAANFLDKCLTIYNFM